MKPLIYIIVVLAISLPTIVYAHGGGCRKASLPQCCHINNETGIVHCH